jgi:hypothetical protein
MNSKQKSLGPCSLGLMSFQKAEDFPELHFPADIKLIHNKPMRRWKHSLKLTTEVYKVAQIYPAIDLQL